MAVPVKQQQPSTQLTPVESYTGQVLGDERRSRDLFAALPAHVSPDRFRRNLINLLMQNPKMMRHDPRLIFREVSKAAALGLLLDPQLGEAYIIESWTSGGPEPQLRTGYRGIMKLARQTKEIANIYPGEVRELDRFEADEGTVKRLEHKPDYRKPRGAPVCYYAVVIYKDGTTDFEVMDIQSLHAIRDRSDAWKAFVAGKIKSTPWSTDEGEMCKKTVLRRLLKRVPQSPELSDALALENAADGNVQRYLPQPSRELRAVPQPRTIEAQLDRFADPDAMSADDPAEMDALATRGTMAEEAASPADAPAGDAAPLPDADPISEARQAGASACDAGVDFEDVPARFRRNKAWVQAWRDGYQARGRQLEEEMNATD